MHKKISPRVLRLKESEGFVCQAYPFWWDEISWDCLCVYVCVNAYFCLLFYFNTPLDHLLSYFSLFSYWSQDPLHVYICLFPRTFLWVGPNMFVGLCVYVFHLCSHTQMCIVHMYVSLCMNHWPCVHWGLAVQGGFLLPREVTFIKPTFCPGLLPSRTQPEGPMPDQ